MRRSLAFATTLFTLLAAFAALPPGTTAEEKGDHTFSLAGGKLTLTAPANWQRKEPANRIVEVEFAVPPVKDDKTPGRLTAMGASGTVDANVDRWVGQFIGAGGAAAKPQRDKTTVGSAEVEIVDLAGTYKDSPGGPFAGGKTINRENYRMLGAIIQTKDAGNYFLKLYGPKATIDESAEGFRKMVKDMKVK